MAHVVVKIYGRSMTWLCLRAKKLARHSFMDAGRSHKTRVRYKRFCSSQHSWRHELPRVCPPCLQVPCGYCGVASVEFAHTAGLCCSWGSPCLRNFQYYTGPLAYLPKLCLKERALPFYSPDKEQICFLPWRKTLLLVFKAICYTNILE